MPLPRKPTRTEGPEAGFASSEHTTGFAIPDGDYTIRDCMCGYNTYGGTIQNGPPAFLVVYETDDGTTFEQPYNAASDAQYLIPSEDGERFVHPDGQSPAKIYGAGAAHMWLHSWEEAGYEFTGNTASQFKGQRVRLIGALAPKGRGADENTKAKTIPLIAKVLAGGGAKRPTATAALRPASAPKSTAPTRAASNGDLNDTALDLVKQVLSKRDGQVLDLEKLPNAVWMKAKMDAKLKPQAQAIKDIITADWLESQEGIETDGENVALS